jgi:hypothetical protein
MSPKLPPRAQHYYTNVFARLGVLKGVDDSSYNEIDLEEAESGNSMTFIMTLRSM